MIRALFGSHTTPGILRGGLHDQSFRHRATADRVANLLTPGAPTPFAAAMQQGLAGAEQADLEREMVELADASMRYDATARLLQRTYQQLRTAIRERG